MPITYSTLQVQFGSLLRISRKQEARQIHARLADNANYDRRLMTAASGFATTDNEDAKVLAALTAYLDVTEVAEMRKRFSDWRAKIESQTEGLGVILAEDLDAATADLESPWISYTYDGSLTDGTIAILRRTGLLGALRRDMVLAAIAQSVTANVVTIGALTALSGNLGTLTATSASAEGHCHTGTLVMRCVNDTVHQCEFSIEYEATTTLPDGVDIVKADNLCRAERSFEDGPTGLTMVLTRTGLAAPTEVTDVGGCFATTSFTVPHGNDSNIGIFYERTTRQAVAPTWLIEFFADAALSRKVGRRTETGIVGTAAGTTTMNNGTQITTTFSMAAANIQMPAAGDTATASWDIDTPRLGDQWTRTLSNDYVGNFSTKIAKLWRGSLPTVGVNAWTDANAADVSMS